MTSFMVTNDLNKSNKVKRNIYLFQKKIGSFLMTVLGPMHILGGAFASRRQDFSKDSKLFKSITPFVLNVEVNGD